MKTARDLLLLSAVAYQQNKYEDAGALFAAAMASDDAPELLQAVNKLDDPKAEPLELEIVPTASTSSGEEKPLTLAQISKRIGTAIAADGEEEDTYEGGGDDDELESDEEVDEEEEEDSDESEVEDGDSLSAVASSAIGIKRKAVKTNTAPKLSVSVSSPIRLK